MSTQRMRDDGRRLADRLSWLSRERPFVLAIPRGGVLVGDALARALNAALDVLIVGKVAADRSGAAIAALADGNAAVIDHPAVAAAGLTPADVEHLLDIERTRQAEELARIRGTWPLPALAGRTVVLVDDAVISGLTMRAAIVAVRDRGARRIVVATPLCATEAIALVTDPGDLVYLESLPAALAVRAHDDREPPTPIGDSEVHDVIARELRDVGVDPFGHLVIDGI